MDINESAPVITRDEILIQAPIDTVWRIQTDVAGWPDWQPDVVRVEGSAPLHAGDTFRWLVAGLDIVSTVQEVDPPHRIVWGGPARGIDGVHVWTLEETADGVLVRTRESWAGPAVTDAPEAAQAALDASLRDWLENLKKRAEHDV